MFLIRQNIKQRLKVQQLLNKQYQSFQKQKFTSYYEILTKINKQRQQEKIRSLKDQQLLETCTNEKCFDITDMKLFYNLSKQIMTFYKIQFTDKSQDNQDIQENLINLYKVLFKHSNDHTDSIQFQNKFRKRNHILLVNHENQLVIQLLQQLIKWSQFQHSKYLNTMYDEIQRQRNMIIDQKLKMINQTKKLKRIVQSKSMNKSIQPQNQRFQSKYDDVNSQSLIHQSIINRQIYYRSVNTELKSLYGILKDTIIDLDHDFLRQYSKKMKKTNVIQNIDKLIANIIKYDQSKIKNTIQKYAKRYPKKQKILNKEQKIVRSQIDLKQIREIKKSQVAPRISKQINSRSINQQFANILKVKIQSEFSLPSEKIQFRVFKKEQLKKIHNPRYLQFDFPNVKVFRSYIQEPQKSGESQLLAQKSDFATSLENQTKKLRINRLKDNKSTLPNKKEFEELKKYIKKQILKNNLSTQEQIQYPPNLNHLTETKNEKKIFLFPKV